MAYNRGHSICLCTLYRKYILKTFYQLYNYVTYYLSLQIFLNSKEIDVVDCYEKDHVTLIRTEDEENTLDIFVENMGRVNYAEFKSPVLNDQRKGRVTEYEYLIFTGQLFIHDIIMVSQIPVVFKGCVK